MAITEDYTADQSAAQTPEDWFGQQGPPPPQTAGAQTPVSTPTQALTQRNAYGTTANLDIESLKNEIRKSYTKRGLPIDEAKVAYMADKASKPDLYSDGQWRVGWNPYLEARMINGGDSADPALAGSEGIIGNPSQYGLSSGGTGLGDFGSLGQGWNGTFNAPSAEDARNTPGYQFKLREGLDAIDTSAAAKGTMLNGGQKKDLMKYAMGLADSTYQQTYQNALGEYGQAYQIFRNNGQDIFDRYDRIANRGANAAANATS